MRSPVDGVLFTLREYPLVYEGSLLARIMRDRDASSASDRRATLLHMTAPSREDFDIPYHDLGPADAPPTLALVGGTARQRAERRLRARAARVLPAPHRGGRAGTAASCSGRVLHPAGRERARPEHAQPRNWPFDGTDVNRMFPGYDAGETTQRIAARGARRDARRAQWRIDIHSLERGLRGAAAGAALRPDRRGARGVARWLGLPAVIERPEHAIRQRHARLRVAGARRARAS